MGGVTLRLAILSRGPRLYSTRRLQEEALKRGIQTSILDPLQFSLSISREAPQILHKGNKVTFDAVLPRIGHSITSHGVALLKQFEQLDIYTANTSEGISPHKTCTSFLVYIPPMDDSADSIEKFIDIYSEKGKILC